MITELTFRIIGFVFSKEGLALLLGFIIASFLMLHSAIYSSFMMQVNTYISFAIHRILGLS